MNVIVHGLLVVLLLAAAARANPYLPKAGEKPIPLRIATSAVTGGFVHLYNTALDYGIIEKYGFRTEHIYIRGSGPSLAALAETAHFVEKNPDKAKAAIARYGGAQKTRRALRQQLRRKPREIGIS